MLSLGIPEFSPFLMLPTLGPTELILILVIVIIFFGVGRLPEVFGGLGRGIREFRRAAKDEMEGSEEDAEQTDAIIAAEGAAPAVASEATPSEKA